MTKPLVLIVEDDQGVAAMYTWVLQNAGFETEIASDGKSALDRLTGIVPDLVLLDLSLPCVSGADVLRSIRADERLAATKVILATAQDRLAEPLDRQADLTLLKPISVRQLVLFAVRLCQADSD